MLQLVIIIISKNTGKRVADLACGLSGIPKAMKFTLATLAIILPMFMLTGCGGGGGRSAPVAVPTAVSVGSGGVSGTVLTRINLVNEEASEYVMSPLEGADVVCGGVTSKTSAEGKYTVQNATTGELTCTVGKKGYEAGTIAVTIQAGKAADAGETFLLPESMGAVSISSNIPGVSVSLDGMANDNLVTGTTVKGLAAGDHVITVASEGYEISDSLTVTVEATKMVTAEIELLRKITSIDIDWNGQTVSVGSTVAMSARCQYADGSEADCTADLAWDSSDAAVATITDLGALTAASPGETNVSATRVQSKITHPGVTVTVACPEDTSWMNGACTGDSLESMSVSPATVSLEEGGSAELAAICVWRLAGEAPCPSVQWNSSAPQVVSVNSAGAVTALAQGVASVTASAGGVASTAASVSITGTQYPEKTCAGAGGFCLDVLGAEAAPDGTVEIALELNSPPAAGLGTGMITLTWEPGTLVYAGSEPAEGIAGIGDSVEDGTFMFVFTSPEPITSKVNVVTISFTLPDGAAEPSLIGIDQSLEATNFTDFGLNLISQSGIYFRDGYAGPAGM